MRPENLTGFPVSPSTAPRRKTSPAEVVGGSSPVSSPHAAGVIQSRGVGVDALAGRANGLHLLSRAVRDVAVECERLLEPNGVRGAPARKLRALDLVKAI